MFDMDPVGRNNVTALGEELTNSRCATDPAMAAVFARTAFLSDSRTDLASVTVPTLVPECAQEFAGAAA